MLANDSGIISHSDPDRIRRRLDGRDSKVLTKGRNDNAISVAFGREEDSRMRRGDLADLAAFVAIADNLSFRAAAAHLGVSPSALSHAMRQLEEHVGVRLLHRTTRSVSVTDAGLRLLERLRPGINQIASALEDLNEERQRPFGRLKISAGTIAAAAAVMAVLGRVLTTHPDGPLEIPRDHGSIHHAAQRSAST